MKSSESTVIHPKYGLNNPRNSHLAKAGEYGDTPEDFVNFKLI